MRRPTRAGLVRLAREVVASLATAVRVTVRGAIRVVCPDGVAPLREAMVPLPVLLG